MPPHPSPPRINIQGKCQRPENGESALLVVSFSATAPISGNTFARFRQVTGPSGEEVLTRVESLEGATSKDVLVPLSCNTCSELSIEVSVREKTALVASRTFRFLAAGGTMTFVAEGEFEAMAARASEQELVSAGDALAARAMARLRARGRVGVSSAVARSTASFPARSLPAPSSQSQQAWDRLTSSVRDSGRRPQTNCGDYKFANGENYYHSLSGTAFYNYGGGAYSLRPGYPARIYTQIELGDECGNTIMFTRITETTISDYGSYAVGVYSAEPPGGDNPVIEFHATAPDVGYGNALPLNTVEQVLNPAGPGYSGFYWSGGSPVFNPVFSDAASGSGFSPYSSFFQWNNKIKELRDYWSGQGLASYTAFKAVYDPNTVFSVPYFFGGKVVFEPPFKWLDDWTMTHEFGHNLQFLVQGEQIAYAGGTNLSCTPQNASGSFTEAFADWHATFLSGNPGGIPSSNGDLYSSCASGGSSVSMNIFAFLWDVFDSVNATGPDGNPPVDSVQYSSAYIFGNWGGHRYDTFDEFYNDFEGRGLWSGQNVAAIKQVNRVASP